MRLLIVLFFCVVTSGCLSQPCPAKLDLSKATITNESRKGNPIALTDEQSLAGDPLNKKGGAPKTVWFPGFADTDHPSSVFIDLKNPAKISSIYLRDVHNKGLFSVEVGTPGHWKTIVNDSLKNYQVWNGHAVDVTSQCIRLTRLTGSSNISELVVYGCMLDDAGPPSAIKDLRVNVITDRSIKILWTSTGDDGVSGSSTEYDIRYSTVPIVNLSDFENAKPVDGEPVPGFSGTVQSYLVRGLKPLTKYYFAMKAKDEEDKISALSNVISTTTSEVTQTNIITMDQFIGTNAFVDDPIDKVKAVGFIREYHNWRWDEGGSKPYKGYPLNEMKFAPSFGAEGSWNFDNYYGRIKMEGLEVSPVIQGAVKWLQGSKSFLFDDKPLDKADARADDPNSYQAKAHHSFQFAARYGSTAVSVDKLTLDPGQHFKSGLGLVRYIEDWNEPNKYWLGPKAKFSPAEYAAFASANYDGHAGTMVQGTKTFGMKKADPKMKFVMGGIAGIDLNWIEDIQYWFENNRPDNAFIPDVINVHHYAWKNGKNRHGGGPAKSPEEDDFKGRMKTIVDYRDQHFPNVEVWISEFGWDTNPGSPLRPAVVASNDIQEVQAQWIVRAYLAFAAAGVDRANMYMLRDVNPESARWFTSCGLVGPKDDWTPKKSWYYVYTLKNSLKNMKYVGEETSTDKNVLIYKFKNIDNSSGAYVVWAKTKIDYIVPSYQLKLVGSPSLAKKIELTKGEIYGIQSTLSIKENTVVIPVSERPVIISVDFIE